ncbi:MAG: hypothetical protein HZC37_21985 [Burkholderiales bacterium]|nr:hypothetical protein [Burkholderiales bacterium]
MSIVRRPRPACPGRVAGRVGALLLPAALLTAPLWPMATAAAAAITVNNGDPMAAQYYHSQAYGEIKDAAGNILAQGGRFANDSIPVGPAAESGSLGAGGSGLTYNTSATLDGFASARTFASADVSNAGAGYGYNVVGSQGSRTQASFSSAATPGRVEFNFDVSGTQSTPPYGITLGRLDFLARSFTPGAGSFFDVFGTDALHAVGAGSYTFTYVGSTASPLDILFYAAAGVVQQYGSVPAGASYSGFADFASTFNLMSINLFTADGLRIDDWTLTDLATNQVVFDEDGRVTAQVPEPATWALVPFALLALAGRGCTRRKAAAR